MVSGRRERIKSLGGVPHAHGSTSLDPLGWKIGCEDIGGALVGFWKPGLGVSKSAPDVAGAHGTH